MRNDIQMVDLKGQNAKIREELRKAILDVVDSAWYINGPSVKSFTKNLAEYLNVSYVIPCGNGTDALQVALMSLGLPRGAEIIVPSFTFVATAEVIKLLGYKPVFADIEEETFNLSPESVRSVISEQTKAIIPVHLFGQSVNMEEILKIAEEFNLYVIEDNAQALGASYTFSNGAVRKTGTMGHIGTTSFYPSKNLSAFGDAGAIFTNDEALAEKIRSIVNHGQTERYYYKYIGVNSRLDSIQAAVLDIKLKRLDDYNRARRNAAKYYSENLQGLPLKLPTEAEYAYHVFHQYTLRVLDGKRDDLKQYLQEQGIPSMIYYPVPLHLQAPYKNEKTSDMKNTEKAADEVLSLPMHSEFSEEQLEYIITKIREFFA